MCERVCVCVHDSTRLQISILMKAIKFLTHQTYPCSRNPKTQFYVYSSNTETVYIHRTVFFSVIQKHSSMYIAVIQKPFIYKELCFFFSNPKTQFYVYKRNTKQQGLVSSS